MAGGDLAADVQGLLRGPTLAEFLPRMYGNEPRAEGFMPWFEVPGREPAQQAMAIGHWSTLGLLNTPLLLAIDTGCV